MNINNWKIFPDLLLYTKCIITKIKKHCFQVFDKSYVLGVQISSCGFARDGVTTVSFHRSVFISVRWKAVISRY